MLWQRLRFVQQLPGEGQGEAAHTLAPRGGAAGTCWQEAPGLVHACTDSLQLCSQHPPCVTTGMLLEVCTRHALLPQPRTLSSTLAAGGRRVRGHGLANMPDLRGQGAHRLHKVWVHGSGKQLAMAAGQGPGLGGARGVTMAQTATQLLPYAAQWPPVASGGRLPCSGYIALCQASHRCPSHCCNRTL